jgi:hypothetical protein
MVLRNKKYQEISSQIIGIFAPEAWRRVIDCTKGDKKIERKLSDFCDIIFMYHNERELVFCIPLKKSFMTGRGICEIPGKATLTKREYCVNRERIILIIWEY